MRGTGPSACAEACVQGGSVFRVILVPLQLAVSLKFLNSLQIFVLGPIRQRQSCVRNSKRRILCTEFLEHPNRLFKLTVEGVCLGLRIADDGRKWIELVGAIAFVDSFLCTADIRERLG